MGSNQSVQEVEEEEDEEEEVEVEDDDDDNEEAEGPSGREPDEVKRVLQQEPEMLPAYASASPLSPQLSSLGTPRLGPSIKVWDPYNVLAPPPPPPPLPRFSLRNCSSSIAVDDDLAVTEVYLINHGESEMGFRPDLIGGRSADDGLTVNGKRQSRALAVFLNSQGVRFSAVYASPLDRARATAISVCQEMNVSDQQIQSSDALTDMSLGHWEGCLRSETLTSETLALIERLQPDFSPPSGESLRQVEFRMVQFLNGTILGLPERLKSELSSPPNQNESHGFPQPNSHPFSNSTQDGDGSLFPPLTNHWDLLQRQRQLTRKKSGKSRLQVVTTTGSENPHHNHYPDEEMSPHRSNQLNSLNELRVRGGSLRCVGVFTHSVPIKCMLTGILGCSPVMSNKICVEDSSVTVLQHSWKTGWQIKKLNDTAHLRLL